jgi:hypothetical protein
MLSLALTGAGTLAPIGAGVLAGLIGGYTGLLSILMVLVAAGLVAVLRVTD